MKNNVKELTRQVLSWVLILSLGLMVANKAVYFHVHKLPDGTLVAHAHPYNKAQDQSPYKKHHHSDAQFLFFSSIEELFLATLIAFHILVPLVQIKALRIVPVLPALLRSEHFRGRAPPSL